MESAIKVSSGRNDVTQSVSASEKAAREEHVFDMLATFYGAVGNPPEADGALALMATFLSARAQPNSINAALERCLLECRYPIRLPDILQRLPGTEAADVHAEKRLAWEAVERYVNKWARWNSERTSAYIEKGAPALAPRILDTVRRSGGWSVYLRMTDADFPHQQKRFFEEYEAWTAVERISDRTRLLEMPNMKELVAAKAMERD